jgi:hypothetical protein
VDGGSAYIKPGVGKFLLYSISTYTNIFIIGSALVDGKIIKVRATRHKYYFFLLHYINTNLLLFRVLGQVMNLLLVVVVEGVVIGVCVCAHLLLNTSVLTLISR